MASTYHITELASGSSSSTSQAPRQSKPDTSSLSSECSTDSEDDEDEEFEDWEGDSAPLKTKSLFDEKVLETAEKAMEHDEKTHGVSLNETVARLGLDFFGRIRLVNYIRKEKPTPAAVNALTSSESALADDAYLIPVIADDQLLQFTPNDEWSDSDDDTNIVATPSSTTNNGSADLLAAQKKIRQLEEKLKDLKLQTQSEMESFKEVFRKRLLDGENTDAIAKENALEPNKKSLPKRDDDTHYFDSYAYNDIHETMLKDTTRTKSYGRYILSNPHLFKGATILDVGCGSGILSMLCARAGAKKVYAVDASDVVDKARANIKKNGLDNIIEVVRGKIEEIDLGADVKVDLIVSEWMGYFLLYESMLDSVLVARDRFLRPGGVLAPSQTKIILSGVDCENYLQERVGWWKDVYGFDMGLMAEEITTEAQLDIVDPETVMTTNACIKDIFIPKSTISSLDFVSDFSITVLRDGPIHAFLGYFDTFFTPDGLAVPEDEEVDLFKHNDVLQVEAAKTDITPVSFTTGPQSTPTHWKQTLFLLTKPMKVKKGDVITGTFHCKKSKTNSRELDVDLHYRIGAAEVGVQTTVQLFKVR